MLVHEFLESWAARGPDAPALIEPTRRTSYAELNCLADRCASLFLESGLGRGDRVVIALDNSATMVAAYLGALKAGAVAVPLQGGARSDRLAHVVADCTPCLVVIDGNAAATVQADVVNGAKQVFVARSSPGSAPGPAAFRDLHESLAACSGDAVSSRGTDTTLAAIIYTSGSTGEPRGVMLTHRNFVVNAQSIVSYLRLTAADRVMCVLPFHYVYGLSLLHTHLAVGGSLVIEPRAAFPNVVLAAMQQHEVTGFAGVPSTFSLMLHRSNLTETQLPHLRYVTQAGGAMAPSKITEWLDRGPRADFYVMYGATEAAARLTYLPPAQLMTKLGSIGRAIPGVEVNVMTEQGAVANPREVGELVARGANISAGYWNQPEETALRFGPQGYRTGDLGYADEDGYLYLVGRQHDMIKVGAHRVGVKEIEDVLHAHPAVFEAAVVAAPHHLLGEAPVAFVALKETLADVSTALRAHCAAHLTGYKVPLRVVVRSELPKLPGSGKLDRTTLRALAAAAPFESPS